MNILILEDNKDDLDNLSQCIKNLFDKLSLKFLIKSTDQIEFLLDHIEEYDLFFLDIEVNQNNGIDVALKIRELKYDAKIIFTSNYSKYLIDGYRAQANRYFIKPIQQEYFDIEMEQVIADYLQKFDGFLDKKIYPVKIYFQDIRYVEFLNKRSYLHFKNDNLLKTRYSLKRWRELLPTYFVQPHQSYLVNVNYISGFTKHDILLNNEENIPISRNYKTSFENQYYKEIKKVF